MVGKTIAIYCFLDDMFQAMGPKTDPHCKLNDAQIATTALLAALKFYGNHASACGYMQEHHKMNMTECDQIYLKIHRKKNSKRPDEVWQAYLKKVSRKPVETSISQIENLFPRKLHAVTAEGFLLKVFLFVLAYTFDELIKD